MKKKQTRKKLPNPKIVEKYLGREKARGRAHFVKQLIEVDPRQTPKEYLDTLIHELVHITFPALGERKVNRAGHIIANGLWKMKFRQVWE